VPFGLQVPQAGDFTPIVKFDARAGRLFNVVYDHTTREKTQVDITTPPPRFAIDFGSLEVGYIRYSVTGPEYRTVAEGKPVPRQPEDRDDQNRLLFRAGFRAKLYGRVLDGLREWSSTAGCVLEAIEGLYGQFKAAPEAAAFKIPIVELSRTIPLTMGKGTKASTNYAPCFTIVSWTDRVPEMGERTVPAPLRQTSASQQTPTAAPVATPVATPAAATSAQVTDDLNYEIPF
jgi:hypothetical protein